MLGSQKLYFLIFNDEDYDRKFALFLISLFFIRNPDYSFDKTFVSFIYVQEKQFTTSCFSLILQNMYLIDRIDFTNVLSKFSVEWIPKKIETRKVTEYYAPAYIWYTLRIVFSFLRK